MDEVAIVSCARVHHNNWLNDRRAQGWTHGLVHDGKEKKNPYLLEFDDLPEEQRAREICGIAAVFRELGLPDKEGIIKTQGKLALIDW